MDNEFETAERNLRLNRASGLKLLLGLYYLMEKNRAEFQKRDLGFTLFRDEGKISAYWLPWFILIHSLQRMTINGSPEEGSPTTQITCFGSGSLTAIDLSGAPTLGDTAERAYSELARRIVRGEIPNTAWRNKGSPLSMAEVRTLEQKTDEEIAELRAAAPPAVSKETIPSKGPSTSTRTPPLTELLFFLLLIGLGLYLHYLLGK